MPAICCPKCQSLVSEQAESCYHCGARLGRVYAAERRSAGFFTDLDFPRGLSTFFVVMYVFMCVVLGPQTDSDASGGGILQAFGPSNQVLYACGAGNEGLVVRDGQWWRLVTSMFVHLSLLHLVMNTLVLWNLGPRVVEVFGTQKASILFVGTGLLGSFASLEFSGGMHELGVSGGASGSLCGYIGAHLYYGYSRRDSAGRALVRQLWAWIIMIGLFGLLVPEIDNAAHAGGFLGGLFLAPLVGFEPQRLARSQGVLAIACGVLVVVSWGLTLWYFGDNLAQYQDLKQILQRFK